MKSGVLKAVRVAVAKDARPKARVSLGASDLTPELKDFIDRAIVPALVARYLDEIELAKKDADAAHSDSNTAAPVRTVRP